MSLIRMIEVLNYIHVVIYIELNATKTASTYFSSKVDDDWMGRTMRYLEGAFNGIFFFFPMKGLTSRKLFSLSNINNDANCVDGWCGRPFFFFFFRGHQDVIVFTVGSSKRNQNIHLLSENDEKVRNISLCQSQRVVSPVSPPKESARRQH